MAKLAWSMKDDETLVAKGDDTGVEFTIKASDVFGASSYALLIPGHWDVETSESITELMLAAQAIEDRTSEPDVTEGAGYAENH
jgi:hypothetical protein